MKVIKARKKEKYLFFKHFAKKRVVTNYSQLKIGKQSLHPP